MVIPKTPTEPNNLYEMMTEVDSASNWQSTNENQQRYVFVVDGVSIGELIPVILKADDDGNAETKNT